jgi:hypothetical protein
LILLGYDPLAFDEHDDILPAFDRSFSRTTTMEPGEVDLIKPQKSEVALINVFSSMLAPSRLISDQTRRESSALHSPFHRRRTRSSPINGRISRVETLPRSVTGQDSERGGSASRVCGVERINPAIREAGSREHVNA